MPQPPSARRYWPNRSSSTEHTGRPRSKVSWCLPRGERRSRPLWPAFTPAPRGGNGGKSQRRGRHGTTSDRRENGAGSTPYDLCDSAACDDEEGVEVIDDLMCPRIGAGTAEYEWMTWQEIAEEAGFPKGVINVVTHAPGAASEIADVFFESPDVRVINSDGHVSACSSRSSKPKIWPRIAGIGQCHI